MRSTTVASAIGLSRTKPLTRDSTCRPQSLRRGCLGVAEGEAAANLLSEGAVARHG